MSQAVMADNFRPFHSGMGRAVAERTVLRKVLIKGPRTLPRVDGVVLVNPADPDRGHVVRICQEFKLPVEISDKQPDRFGGLLRWETWGEVAERVATGNATLSSLSDVYEEYDKLKRYISRAVILMSGRHLQHGDANQSKRPMEVFTNCSTAVSTSLLFYLLLSGSGVGRAYDDELMKVDFNQMPIVVPVIDWHHKDVSAGLVTGYMTKRMAEHCYASRKITYFRVPDSREGWAKVLEIIERMTYECRRDEVFIPDFSDVRDRGAPIMGMQGRPASGPGPLMSAISSIARIREAGMEPWRAAMYADHYAAECVLVGGARRAARMSTKHWRDHSIFDFINIKRGGFLWSSNNSVTIDDQFRRCVSSVVAKIGDLSSLTLDQIKEAFDVACAADRFTALERHAFSVLLAVSEAAYCDGTGEPGLINQDRLSQKNEGVESYVDGLFAGCSRYQLEPETVPMMQDIAKAVIGLRLTMITNPCGEIALLMLGGYCTLADVVPFHAASFDEAEDAFRAATRALIRVNTMDCLYRREVERTNRIGVSITGFHEWAYDAFGFTWHDIIKEDVSKAMWLMLSRFKRAVVDEAKTYAEKIGVAVPHTNTTIKPAGTTSKLFGLTEGAHLPSMREFLRWVQFRSDDPLVQEYAAKGYPTRNLKSYDGTTIVGFPTKPRICDLDGGKWVVTAAEATPEEQYEFLRLLEKYWIVGVDEDCNPLQDGTGNQVSYTMKFDPSKVDFGHYMSTLIGGQFSIRCCSVLPAEDTSAYEYLPEEAVDKLTYERIAAAIQEDMDEEVDFEHVDCSTGGCPVDFEER